MKTGLHGVHPPISVTRRSGHTQVQLPASVLDIPGLKVEFLCRGAPFLIDFTS